MGYRVQLLRGDVSIMLARQGEALAALQALDQDRDDLKSGWHQGLGDEPTRQWAYCEPDLRFAGSLPRALQAIRFDPVIVGNGDIIAVTLQKPSPGRGDELHHWTTLAPFVEPGGIMDWCGEDESVWRWRFDGRELVEVPGRLSFDRTRPDRRRPQGRR
jgi:hypothetical protein